MPSSRHENSVERVGEIARKLGHIRQVNNQEAGKDGWKFYPVVCPDQKTRPYIADCLIRTPHGAMVNIEVDYNHETGPMKIATLKSFGIVTIKANPTDVDLWAKDPLLLQAEIDYALDEFWKQR